MSARSYSADELWDLADEHSCPDVHVGRAGSITGVVIPRALPEGALLSVNTARKLAAQLLLACELHDAIADGAVDSLTAGEQHGDATLDPDQGLEGRPLRSLDDEMLGTLEHVARSRHALAVSAAQPMAYTAELQRLVKLVELVRRETAMRRVDADLRERFG